MRILLSGFFPVNLHELLPDRCKIMRPFLRFHLHAAFQKIPEPLRRQEYPLLTPEEWLTRKQAECRELAKKTKFHYHDEIPLLLETVELAFPQKS